MRSVGMPIRPAAAAATACLLALLETCLPFVADELTELCRAGWPWPGGNPIWGGPCRLEVYSKGPRRWGHRRVKGPAGAAAHLRCA